MHVTAFCLGAVFFGHGVYVTQGKRNKANDAFFFFWSSGIFININDIAKDRLSVKSVCFLVITKSI